MSAKIIILAVFSSLLLLTACGGTTQPPEPIITLSDDDIRNTNNYEELLGLLKTANIRLADKNVSDYADDFARKSILEDKLVELAIANIESQFTNAREVNGVLGLATIESIDNSLIGESELPTGKWQRVKDRIALEKRRTRQYVEEQSLTIADDLSNEERLNYLDEFYRLTGDSTWLQQKNEFIDQLITNIRVAKNQGVYTEALQADLALLRQTRGDDLGLMNELTAYDAKVYEHQFLTELGNGDPDAAYQIFVKMTQANNFEQIRAELEGTSQTMADYFIAKADEAMTSDLQLAKAYRWYQQGLDVYQHMGLGQPSQEQFNTIISEFNRRFEGRKENGDLEAALAYLLMIGEFDKTHALYRSQLNPLKDQIQQRAVKKVTTTDFSNSAQRHDYGSVLSSFITQHLFESIPNDVRIVERQQYEAILRERELGGQAPDLSAVDYFITGSVLESKVDTTEVQGKKTLRVIVGRESIPNPAYVTWLKLDSKERKKVDKPSETISVDRHENVSIGITEHRKLGIVSVSYRLVEADSGRIVFPDSISKEEEHKDNSTEGVEMGEFILPFKLAQLPSDVEILDTLAKSISLDVGENLVGLLKDQEKKYLAQADVFAGDRNCPAQITALARASAIQELKGMENSETNQTLRDVTVSCYQ
ncbi:CsgG/HfaB family protein [Sessilibacter corallicola]|uniref:Curli production assembly/transport component CsgG n=1 Tax=Sessilibacter corallicola TaxID=2904075 RepID=A0ABQ0A8U2_9GAMM